MADFRLAEHNHRSEYYPRFSEDEFTRREENVRELMREAGYDALLFYATGDFSQWTIGYLTNYRPPFPTYLVFFEDPDVQPTLFAGLSNHVQYIREVSRVEDIRLQLDDPARNIGKRLGESDVGVETVGIVGYDPRYEISMPYGHYERLTASVDAEFVDATIPFLRLTSVKSTEEQELVEEAARIADAGLYALADAITDGASERDLEVAFRTACLNAGGSAQTDFITSAPMEGAEPGEGLPWKKPSRRSIGRGDVVLTEVSANTRGYASQIHRPVSVGEPPSDTYVELFSLAEEVYEGMLDALQAGNTVRDIYEALAPVENSEFKTYDVMLHGYGNGYIHPFVGTEASNYWPGADDPVTADWTFENGMVMVVQPNVVTADERQGLQFGTTAIVRENGAEVLHEYPAEFGRV